MEMAMPLPSSSSKCMHDAVGMMDDALARGISRGQGLVERLRGEQGIWMIGERPVHDPAREHIEHDREIGEVFGEPNVGDVGDPELVEPAGLQRRDRSSITAILATASP